MERLIAIAYVELLVKYQTGIKLETFCSTLGYMPLQRHLPGVLSHSLENGVRAGNEFLQMNSGGEKATPRSDKLETRKRKKFSTPRIRF